jgi:hypothetical protein
VAGGAERAEQFGPHPGHVAEQTVVAQPLDEGVGGPHGPDGVRTRRPDADGEEVEDADGHVSIMRCPHSEPPIVQLAAA